MEITDDSFFNLIKHLSIREIRFICQSNKHFSKLCKKYANTIYNSKCKSLKQTITSSDKAIRTFAEKHKFGFDDASKRALKKSGKSYVIDKVWVDLMYFLELNHYDEAEALLSCSELPVPPMSLFFYPQVETMPSQLMELLLNNLTKSFGTIMDIAGYDNKDDFVDDYPLHGFKHIILRDVIKKQM